jgi:hypothetical protein
MDCHVADAPRNDGTGADAPRNDDTGAGAPRNDGVGLVIAAWLSLRAKRGNP